MDYASSLTGIQYARQTEYPAFRKAYHKFRYPGSGYTFVGFNLKDPRFADLRVRQAFAHAINKQELIDGIRLGLAREATGPIRPGTWAYTDDVKRFPFDPEKAKALLAEAGWKDRDGDGLIEDQDGKPFTLTIRTNQGNDERKKIAELIQQRLKEIGIQVDIQLIEWAAFIKEFVKPRRFEVVVLGLGSGTDPDQFVVWHSSQRGPDQMNRTGYANPEVDRLLELGRSSCVQEERVQYYHRIQQILAEDLPMIFLYTADALPVVAARIRGVARPRPASSTTSRSGSSRSTAAIYLRLDGALRPPPAPPLDPAPGRHHLRLLRGHQPGSRRAPRLPDPGGSERLGRGQGAVDQGVRAGPAHPRAVLAVAQARGRASTSVAPSCPTAARSSPRSASDCPSPCSST